jgi:mannosyltransferase
VKAQIGILLLWSPWIPAFIRQASSIYQEYWIPKPGWDTIVQTLRSFLNEYTLDQASWAKLIWVLYALVLGLAMVHYRMKLAQFFFLAALFAIPFLAELMVSIRRPVFLDRTLIWTTIPLFLLLAAGILHLRFRLLIMVVLGIFATNNLFSTGDYYKWTQKEDWSGAAGFVANFAQKGDLVLFNASMAQIPFDYYFKAYEMKYLIQVDKHGVPVDLFDSGILEPKMTESDIPRLVSMLNGRQTVWLVYSHNWYTDPGGLIAQMLASQMRLVYTREFYGVQVQIYAAP